MLTSIYINESADQGWPDDGVFYHLAGNGLFLCRNHELFKSCVPVKAGPSELPHLEAFLEPRFPPIPRDLIEQITGFFAVMAKRHNCEAGAFLVYDRLLDRVTVEVTDQVSTVSEGYHGRLWPVGIDYESIATLAANQLILGTIHSHVYGPAYSSGIDVHDETDKPGVHVVVGRLDQEPPEFHAEAVVDQERFRLDPHLVIEDYEARRDDFPQQWIERVKVEVTQPWGRKVYPTYDGSYGGAYDGGYDGGYGGGYGGSRS